MPKNAVVEEGKFTLEGIPWKKYIKITHRGKTYDTKTTYCWTDPDYPLTEDVDRAIRKAKRAGEKNPQKTWNDYLEYSRAEFRFKCSGFLKYGNSVDCLPEAQLGRISVEDLEVCEKE